MISSSPRGDGSMAATASWMAGVNRYTPTSARLDGGCSGFSTSRTTWPSSSTAATPKRWGSGTGHSRICAAGGGDVVVQGGLVGPGPVGLEGGHELHQALLEHVVAQVHDEVVVTQEVPGDEHAVGQARGLVLGDVGDLGPERDPSPTASMTSGPVSPV